MKKCLSILLAIVLLLACIPLGAISVSAEAVCDGAQGEALGHTNVNGVCSVCGEGFHIENGNTYYHRADGTIVKGFTKIGEDYYYFHPGNGKMWADCRLYVGANDYGIPAASYNFDADGKMITDGFVTRPDGYTYYLQNMVPVKGFAKVGEDYYFFHPKTGRVQSNKMLYVGANEYGVPAATYSFGDDGKMQTDGFITRPDGYTYYLQNMVPMTGFAKIGEDYYYFHPINGRMYADCQIYMGKNGYISSGRYNFDSNGKLVKTGFITKPDGNTYYYKDLEVATGTIPIDGHYYCFDKESGKLYKSTKVWIYYVIHVDYAGPNGPQYDIVGGYFWVDENGIVHDLPGMPWNFPYG